MFWEYIHVLDIWIYIYIYENAIKTSKTQSLNFNFKCLLVEVFTFCFASSWMSLWVGQIAGAKHEGNCFRKAGLEFCSLLSFPESGSRVLPAQEGTAPGLSLTQGTWIVICKKIRYLTDSFCQHCGKNGASEESSFFDLK